MDWRKLDIGIMAALIIGVWFLNISVWFKLPLTLLCLLVVPGFPLLRLTVSQIGATDVGKEKVQSYMKLHQWYTIPELARIMRQALGYKVSHLNLMNHVYAMKGEGKIEGRERNPPEPSYFREGNIWEYRRVL